MQKAGEPENDAGFPKHNYSQLKTAVVIHTPLSLYNYRDAAATYTRPYSNSACEPIRALHVH